MSQRQFTQLGVDDSTSVRPDAGSVHGYPRPMMQRRDWTSLNGRWEFALDPEGTSRFADEVAFDDQIEVPFSPETTRSGIADPGLYKACWYRRTVEAPGLGPSERLILHCGAVDYEARVWVDGTLAMEHEGGYTPFSADITD